MGFPNYNWYWLLFNYLPIMSSFIRYGLIDGGKGGGDGGGDGGGGGSSGDNPK